MLAQYANLYIIIAAKSATIFKPWLPSKASEAARFEKCDESLSKVD